MSKNLIISKLNKCNAYEYSSKPLKLQESTSKISTSTKTQQSPILYQVNPQFTFRSFGNNQISTNKSNTQEFFDNFQTSNQIIYQKVIIMRQKPLQRSLQFQLLNLQNEEQINLGPKIARKLQFYHQEQKRNFPRERIQIQYQNIQNYPENIKTQYVEPQFQSRQQYYQNSKFGYNQQIYDSKKYRLSRQKPQSREILSKHHQLGTQRCQTEAADMQYFPSPICSNILSLINNQTKNEHEVQNAQHNINFKNYYFKENQSLKIKNHQLLNAKVRQEHSQNTERYSVEHNKRKGSNSSRLMLFRKQRQHQMRKSLLQQCHNSKSNIQECPFNQNKENVDNQNIRMNSLSNLNSNMKKLPMNNLSQAAQKKLKNQYSQRYLLSRKKYLEPVLVKNANNTKRNNQQKHMQKCNENNQPQSRGSYLNKQTQARVQSIRKQLKEIYQVNNNHKTIIQFKQSKQLPFASYNNNSYNSRENKQNQELRELKERQRSRLKLIRDQQIYQLNRRNELRRVGSISRF